MQFTQLIILRFSEEKTGRQQNCGKVMFSVVFVCPQVGIPWSMWPLPTCIWPRSLDIELYYTETPHTQPTPTWTWDLTVQGPPAQVPPLVMGPHSTETHPLGLHLDMFEIVHCEARTVSKREVRILLECFLVSESVWSFYIKVWFITYIKSIEKMSILPPMWPAKAHSDDWAEAEVKPTQADPSLFLIREVGSWSCNLTLDVHMNCINLVRFRT